MYDKAVEEIKKIFQKNDWFWVEEVIPTEELDNQLDKDLSDFLKRFEEGLVRDIDIDEGIENFKEESPMFDKNDLD